MFLSVILTIAAADMALQCGLTAFSVPFASWTWLSWLYLAMAAVMIGVCVVSARRAVRAYKKQAEKTGPGAGKAARQTAGAVSGRGHRH